MGGQLAWLRLRLLLWKSWTYRRRNWVMTAIEIFLLPLAVFLLTVAIDHPDKNKMAFVNTELNETMMVQRLRSYLDQETRNGTSQVFIGYAPEEANGIVDALMQEIKDTKYDQSSPFRGSNAVIPLPHKTEQLMDSTQKFLQLNGSLMVFGLVFQKLKGAKVDYKLRLPAVPDVAEEGSVLPLPPGFNKPYPGPGRYTETYLQFSAIQVLLDRVISEKVFNLANMPSISLQPFPYPRYAPLPENWILLIQMQLTVVPNCFVIILISMVRGMVGEKESGFKALLVTMGVPNWMHILAWFISSFIIASVAMGLVTVFQSVVPLRPNTSALLAHSNVAVLGLFGLIYVIQSLALCLFIASLFETAAFGIICAAGVSSLLSFLPIMLGGGLRVLSFTEKSLLCILPNVAYNIVMNTVADFEREGTGAHWANIWEAEHTEYKLSIADVFCVMAASSIFYFAASFYLESVIPTKHGIPKPFYYPFLRSSWCTNVKQGEFDPQQSKQSAKAVVPEGKNFEAEPSDLQPGVAITDIRKEFGKKPTKVAVDGVSLNLFHGQCTVLLGHNGAGKTTLISILTGLQKPTSGTAVINGCDITKDIEGVQKDLSLCPQMNQLLDDFTVADHLIFFARLKGMSWKEAGEATKAQILALHMKEKAKIKVKKLSGGQKRRVQLGMALIGGAKVIFLDEPTSGLDPEARREMWDLLLEVRRHRTVCLTTHFMEEADVLGDRIAIMEKGRIRCCGTPLFLKRYYGTGYTLHVTFSFLPSKTSSSYGKSSLAVKEDQEEDSAIAASTSSLKATTRNFVQRQAAKLLQVVAEHFQGVSLKSGTGQKTLVAASPQIDINLPVAENEDMTSKLPAMFRHLYDKQQTLNIKDIGLSITTMDEVFSTVMVKAESETESQDAVEGHVESKRDEETEEKGWTPTEKVTGLRLALKQFKALLIKKMLSMWSNKSMFATQLGIPIALTMVVVYTLTLNYEPADPVSPTKIQLSRSLDSVILFSSDDEKLTRAFKATVGRGAEIQQVQGKLTDKLLQVSNNDLHKYRRNYQVAHELSKKSTLENTSTIHIKALYSSLDEHAAQVAINVASNTMLKELAPDMGYSLQMTYHPWAGTEEMESIKEAAAPGQLAAKLQPFLYFSYTTVLVRGMSVAHATFLILPLEEKLNKAKQLQLMTGASPLIYWGAFFIWDLLICIFVIVVMILSFLLLQGKIDFFCYYGAGSLLLLWFVYNVTQIFYFYVVSLVFRSVTMGFAISLFIQVLVVTAIACASTVARTVNSPAVSWLLQTILRINPETGCVTAQMLWFAISLANNRCRLIPKSTLKSLCDPKSPFSGAFQACCENCKQLENATCFKPLEYLTWKVEESGPGQDVFGHEKITGLMQELTSLSIVALVYLSILITVEYNLLEKLGRNWRNRQGSDQGFRDIVQDEGVVEESRRVEDIAQSREGASEYVMVTNKFCKSFGTFAAVSNVSFGVEAGECFGLLGVNGAGKTTMFRMLTGDLPSTAGDSFVWDLGHRSAKIGLYHDKTKYLRCVGYCPQFDAFIGSLTGQQMLQLFARLRGVPERSVTSEAIKWLKKLGLEKSAEVKCVNYSGGMQRRLSVAMAMIGEPPVVLLDEPTSGVDPVSRRQFWKVMDILETTGQAVILTSHSMDECEALCARLAIMVNGQLQCLGGVEHLKNKFAQGKNLEIKLKSIEGLAKSPKVDELQQDISNNFEPCKLKEKHQNYLNYSLLNNEMRLDKIFGILEGSKRAEASIIEEYSVSETTLEQVFLAFARSQYPERKVKGGCCKSCKNT